MGEIAFTAEADHECKVARVHCVPCDAWVVIRFDSTAFVEVVGDFTAEHRPCEPVREIDLRAV